MTRCLGLSVGVLPLQFAHSKPLKSVFYDLSFSILANVNQ